MENDNKIIGLVSKAQADDQMGAAIAKARNHYLSKVGSAVCGVLDSTLDTEHDKLSVMVGLACALVVRSKGKWEEFEPMVRKAFEAHAA